MEATSLTGSLGGVGILLILPNHSFSVNAIYVASLKTILGKTFFRAKAWSNRMQSAVFLGFLSTSEVNRTNLQHSKAFKWVFNIIQSSSHLSHNSYSAWKSSIQGI